MPTHDIIDNRREKLVDHINRMLDSTETARFAVGYFFLSGLESIAGRLDDVKELRLLIGNTTNHETLEQMAEGYRRLELVQDAMEAQTYPKRTAMARMADETATNIRATIEQMDQTDEGEVLVKTLVRMIVEQRLKQRLDEPPLSDGKRLIFTQYADTARYLYENLNPGGKRNDIDVIYSGDKSKARAVGRFAPLSNPEYEFSSGESELFTLVATDVLAEGLNLQDCHAIFNYDLHWNPVRLIQRFGRIDRIGSEHEVVYGFNFLPETGIEKNLGLREKLHNRIQEIHDTIGEDSAILDKTEQINEEAMYAIYESKGNQLSLFEEEEEFLDLNEAEEIMRQLRKENPGEYERIATLHDGIRSVKPALQHGLYVFCAAGRYQQLFLADEQGNVLSRDMPRILGAIKVSPELNADTLPTGYNAAVMRIKRRFVEEAKHRQSEREHTLSLTQSQRYLLRELRELFKYANDEDEKAQINLLEKAFRGPITTAINRELNFLRKNGVKGRDLLKSLATIFFQHNKPDWVDNRTRRMDEDETPRIICSEGFV